MNFLASKHLLHAFSLRRRKSLASDLYSLPSEVRIRIDAADVANSEVVSIDNELIEAAGAEPGMHGNCGGAADIGV